ncbi:hypothetical protein ZYGR_0W00830 [Zygosaccharomyces rouxii]|uniref:ADP-ribosylation factor GTPase-activating protein n=2 Tax=Zygosaccharomyces rouxii TaxID=4956 RepID=C5DZ44_ZYGRC|nr:uncharacterized protein ZYRO0F18084g [Zygosaccharomyces rouxii]KAH9201234.1 ARF GAP effector protein 1 [Zygosaccharomyces rouxii]GAV50557.1 hypothetical protein ZYGR_0W00830 [Zygosaccharomyces rouxii]CAQ43319.1 ARF GAP effector protein 1 [Zygosaccharomyces rouxii]CAR29055.1 ZYRO0F18084p [Zygosaccharomyces rouxii]
MRRLREGLLQVRNHHKSDDGFQLQLCSLGEHEFRIGGNSVVMENAHIRKTTSRTLDVEDYDMHSRFTLQLPTEKELNSWLDELKRVAGSTFTNKKATVPNKRPAPIHRSMTLTALNGGNNNSREKRNSVMNETPVVGGNSKPITLVELVRKQNCSNCNCCECNSNQSVEWISVNLLCVVCIKCSGVHRSLGSHISKIRSLTLDNFTSPEVLHLLRYKVSNANVNSVYESNLPVGSKIKPFASDVERSQFITEKYKNKAWVDDITTDINQSFKELIKAIHLNSIYMLQRCLAQSKLGLREIVQRKTPPDEELPTIFQYSLKHHDMVHGRPLYYITEFLLLNGLPVDEIPLDCLNSDHPMYRYWKKRFETYGTYHWSPQGKSVGRTNSGITSISSSNSISSNDKNANNKRWSLNAMPTTAQVIMAPTNLLTVHKSLRLSRRGHSSGNN